MQQNPRAILMEWEELYNNYCLGQNPKEHILMMDTVRDWFAKENLPSLDWFLSALHNPEKKQFLYIVLGQNLHLPKKLFEPMLHAAVMEKDPSFNRFFIFPCVWTFGSGPVRVRLLDYLINGSNEEKAGAARAFYWAHSREPDDELLVQEINIAVLSEFIQNSNLNVRECLVSKLILQPQAYPEEFRDKIKEAITIARSLENGYIRHRIEIQLGSGGPYMPLPEQ